MKSPELFITSLPLLATIEAAALAAFRDRPLNVLILGEAGVGKRTLAEWLHHRSPRADGPLLRVRCDGPADFVAKKIFGWEGPGALEAAKGGTVVLDHVDALPAALQATLMQVIEQRQVWRVGGSKGGRLDTRLISTAGRELARSVAAGTFRGDLAPKLSPVTITLPPLGERPEDVEPLARHFLWRLERRFTGPARTVRLSDEALALMKTHAWPGNAHQLETVLTHAFMRCDGEIRVEHLKADRESGPPAPNPGDPMNLTPSEVAERKLIIEVIGSGSEVRIAQRLGMSRRTLLTKLARYQIPRPSRIPRPTRGWMA